jgi:hypothetical protein
LPSSFDHPAKPIYVLLRGDGKPQIFVGNGSLRQLVSEAARNWIDRGGTPPPRLVMVGEGTQQDFDAAFLTMRLSHRDSEGGGADAVTALDDFAVPAEFLTLPEFVRSRTSSVRMPEGSVVREGDHYAGTYEFSGGTVRVLGRTREVVAAILAAIEHAIRAFLAAAGVASPSDLDPGQRNALAQEMQQRAETALRQFFQVEPDLKQQDDAIEVTTRLGNQVTSWRIAKLGRRGVPAVRMATAFIARTHGERQPGECVPSSPAAR